MAFRTALILIGPYDPDRHGRRFGANSDWTKNDGGYCGAYFGRPYQANPCYDGHSYIACFASAENDGRSCGADSDWSERMKNNEITMAIRRLI